MNAYSFLDTQANIAGPGGILNLGAGASVAEEGISIEPVEDKNVMTIGADGRGQHSLVGSDAAVVIFKLLKTSPLNAALMLMYDLQSATSALWGQNVITVIHTGLQDYHVIQACAFKKKPSVVYDKTGPMLEWAFDGIKANSILGV